MNFEGIFFDTKDYKLDEYMGKGTFGKTYIVQCSKDNNDYIGKIININPEKGFPGQEQINLLTESTLLIQLDHPSLVKLLGINFQSIKYKTQLEPTILTEFYPNGTLKEILDELKNDLDDPYWTATKKYIFLLGISNAMKYLHKKGIVHGDFKTQNILIDDDYYPKICDFGLSRIFPNLLSKSIQLITEGENGSPIYVAPELLANPEAQCEAPVDVYSFGIIAYEIITQKDPYFELTNSISITDLIEKIKNDYRPQKIEGITEKMWELISQCWNANANERPSFEDIFSKLAQDFSYFSDAVDENEVNEYLKNLPDSIEKVEATEKVETTEKDESTEKAESTENNEANNQEDDANKLGETVNDVLNGLTGNPQSETTTKDENNNVNNESNQTVSSSRNKGSKLIAACEEGNVELVKNILSSEKVDVNEKLISILNHFFCFNDISKFEVFNTISISILWMKF